MLSVSLCTCRARVKLLEESAAQRETQARQECEDLIERLAAATRSAEQERSELQAQYQRKLTQGQQDRDREVERLRDLQRYSEKCQKMRSVGHILVRISCQHLQLKISQVFNTPEINHHKSF